MAVFWKTSQQMGLASIIVAGGILLSRFMGLIRDKLISLLFGATIESDIYFAAFVIPDFINYMLAGGYFSITLIPFLTKYFEQDKEDGWRFFSTVFTWVTISITAFTVAAFIFAPKLAYLAAPGLNEEALARLTYFLRIILPAQICFLCGSCFSALLFMRKQFAVPALAPLVYNLFIIGCGVAFRGKGMEGFCWGVLVGSVIGNFLLPFLAARAGGGITMHRSFHHSGLRNYFITALPLMIGKSITIVDEQFVRIFGSMAGVGAISWLNYARRIMLVPVSVVAQAAGVATYPFMAELFVKGEFSRFNATVKTALRNVITLLIPLSIWMMVGAEPIIRLIFEQGRFAAFDTAQTAGLLRVLCLCLACWGYQQVLGRAFYARTDTLSPAVLGTAITVLSIPVYLLLTNRMGAMGVAVASSASIVAYSVALTFWWKKKADGEAFSGLPAAALKLTGISVASALPAWAAGKVTLFDPGILPHLAALLEIILSGMVFGICFVALSVLIVPEAVRPFLEKAGPVGRRLLRTKPAQKSGI